MAVFDQMSRGLTGAPSCHWYQDANSHHKWRGVTRSTECPLRTSSFLRGGQWGGAQGQGVWPGQPRGAPHSDGSTLGLTFLLSPPSSYFFKQTSPHFLFTLGLANSVAGPAQEAVDKGHQQVRAPVVCLDTSGPAICLAPSWCGCGKRGLLRCIWPHTATERAWKVVEHIYPGFCHLAQGNTNCGHLLPLRKALPSQRGAEEGKTAAGFQKPSSPWKKKSRKQQQGSWKGPSSVQCLRPPTPPARGGVSASSELPLLSMSLICSVFASRQLWCE